MNIKSFSPKEIFHYESCIGEWVTYEKRKSAPFIYMDESKKICVNSDSEEEIVIPLVRFDDDKEFEHCVIQALEKSFEISSRYHYVSPSTVYREYWKLLEDKDLSLHSIIGDVKSVSMLHEIGNVGPDCNIIAIPGFKYDCLIGIPDPIFYGHVNVMMNNDGSFNRSISIHNQLGQISGVIQFNLNTKNIERKQHEKD